VFSGGRASLPSFSGTAGLLEDITSSGWPSEEVSFDIMKYGDPQQRALVQELGIREGERHRSIFSVIESVSAESYPERLATDLVA
jgi:hypothetical protein